MSRRRQKVVLFVSSSNDLSDFLYDLFTEDHRLKNEYFIEGVAHTRESAMRTARKKRPDLIIFFEKTQGALPLSELMYRLRMNGSRIIFISSNRRAGDRLLEILVGYGVYDIITDDTIDIKTLYSFITEPREFKDVSIFHRMVKIDDDSTKELGFKIPNIQQAMMNSETMYVDYIQNPYSKIQLEEKVIDGPQTIRELAYTQKEESEKARAEQRRRRRRPRRRKKEVDDIDIDFSELR